MNLSIVSTRYHWQNSLSEFIDRTKAAANERAGEVEMQESRKAGWFEQWSGNVYFDDQQP